MCRSSLLENTESVAQPATLVTAEIETSKDIEAVRKRFLISLTGILSDTLTCPPNFGPPRNSVSDIKLGED